MVKEDGLQITQTTLDNVTPTYEGLSAITDDELHAVGEQLPMIFQRELILAYQRGPIHWRRNKPWKAKYGVLPIPMYLSGDLHRSLFLPMFYYVPLKGRGYLAYNWQFPKNKGFQYVWSSEFGAWVKKVKKPFYIPKRPFIREALRNAGIQAANQYSGVIGRMRSLSGGMEVTPVRIEPIENEVLPEVEMVRRMEFPRSPKILPSIRFVGPLAYAMFFVPPSTLYKYWGMASDIRMSLTSSFGLDNITRFLTGWGAGTAGVSKKVWRRKIRRRIWGGYRR